MITTVFSTEPRNSWTEDLSHLAAVARRKPFDGAATEFVGQLSKCILSSQHAREFPELAALAHWFRPASIRDMAARLSNGDERVLARGVVFILAPANVDVLFVYGWLLSLLSGNASVVRVSRKPSAVRDMLLSIVEELAKDDSVRQVLADSWLITYDHNDKITEQISLVCHARLVWGGDATINAIRSVPLNPLAVEVSFADRFSLAAFDALALSATSDEKLADTARLFANDTLWFAQQACSSPRAVIWIGSAVEVSASRKKFWPHYRAAARIFPDEPATVVSRVTDLFALAADGLIDSLGAPLAMLPGSGIGTQLSDKVREIHSGNGLFVEYIAASAQEVPEYLSDKDQTLVVFGLSEQDIDNIIEGLPNRALDRIVTPGQATDFAIVWDGTDLLEVLTRKVSTPKRINT